MSLWLIAVGDGSWLVVAQEREGGGGRGGVGCSYMKLPGMLIVTSAVSFPEQRLVIEPVLF